MINIKTDCLIQFNNVIFRGDGTASVSHAVPDSLTSYTISAFAIHPVDGLGIATSSSQVSFFYCLWKIFVIMTHVCYV